MFPAPASRVSSGKDTTLSDFRLDQKKLNAKRTQYRQKQRQRNNPPLEQTKKTAQMGGFF
jgi:hypothetical protein